MLSSVTYNALGASLVQSNANGTTTTKSYDPNRFWLTDIDTVSPGLTLDWSPENQITQVVAKSTTTTFAYGPEGARIKKTSGNASVKYPFGDDYEIAANGTVTKYFDAGFGPKAKKVGSTLYWLHTDRLGSVNVVTLDDGSFALRRAYRSYGELLGQTGTHTESLGYIGQRTDSETGLTYLHARYYDSQLGMFLSPDPAGADSNTYRYGLNDPREYERSQRSDSVLGGHVLRQRRRYPAGLRHGAAL